MNLCESFLITTDASDVTRRRNVIWAVMKFRHGLKWEIIRNSNRSQPSGLYIFNERAKRTKSSYIARTRGVFILNTSYKGKKQSNSLCVILAIVRHILFYGSRPYNRTI
ncbi:hypothetical protein RF11_01025 [Thelohanellus kitauei]|uniref:Uncharacterized protein n=1 Tax=Thelohanellus kitauei TaxID=669202 RepID=A0A0C2NA99_THEKT|nr:hypothetical protein RF11_01025 [Thelohanellus kitauei]